jgi:hypothetical protein
MKNKIPILLVTKDRPNLLEKVLARVIKFTDWEKFDLWILDNLSTASNKKVISMYKDLCPFINIYSSSYNQLAVIQNEVIKKLKADFYIKIDDDILVTENWTNAFVNVFERNHQTMSFGGVIMPINGFGWIPFMDIMGFTDEFKKEFPDTLLIQECIDVPVYSDKLINKFLWDKCLNLDATAKTFVDNQHGKFQDLLCPHRYSIGAIVFSHQRWEEMGGWRVQDNYSKVLKKQLFYKKIADKIKSFRKMHDNDMRLHDMADMISGAYQGILGLEELVVANWTKEKGYTIPITTEGMVFHFSFGPTDQYLMNKVYTKIAF